MNGDSRSSRRYRSTALAGWITAILVLAATMRQGVAEAPLSAGFSRVDITPEILPDRPVWLAGYGWGRRATGVHDPLYATCLVLKHADRQLALVSVDLVGLQLPTVQKVRALLLDFDYILVSSTHNHEGPDTVGIWGRTPFHRGVDDTYLDHVVRQIAQGALQASERAVPARVLYGTAEDESLLGDSRKPYVKDGVLRVLRFENPENGDPTGILLQWNSHPEALGPGNTQVTADFPAATVSALETKFHCPVAYFTGAVGGLMAPPDGVVRDEQGQLLQEGQFEYARRYGESVAELAGKALQGAAPIRLDPFTISAHSISVPVQNPLFRTAGQFGLVQRPMVAWTGDYRVVAKTKVAAAAAEKAAVVTEVVCLRLGELPVIGVPGEIYPELVYGGFQDPADPAADYPDAPLEKPIAEWIPDRRWLLLGLANDEIGYIIPQRQWDQIPPYAYGRARPQYGEVNSCGPEVAPILMQALEGEVRQALAP